MSFPNPELPSPYDISSIVTVLTLSWSYLTGGKPSKVLTFLHPILICKVTYWIPVVLLLEHLQQPPEHDSKKVFLTSKF
jgi:hypothetical protein